MIKFQLLNPDARLPTRAHPTDAGMDLYAPASYHLSPGGKALVDLGLASEFPNSYFCLLKDRSSMAARGLHILGGVIDPAYRGSWKVILINLSDQPYVIKAGDRIAQAIPFQLPWHTIVQVDELSPPPLEERQEHGFGSTGR